MPVNMWLLTAFLLYTNIFSGGRCLKITSLVVPTHANLGESVTLQCHFDLGKSNLYSVKWYKDDFEFFSFLPKNNPMTNTFSVTGISLNEKLSGRNVVTLRSVSYSSSGSYKCEVSTEAPTFNTSLKSKNMTVLAFPDSRPIISGIQDTYTVTEYIMANCTSGKSNPGPKMAWYINGIEPDSWYVIESKMVEYDGPLYARQLNLQYPASRITQKKEEITLNCTAVVADMPASYTAVKTKVSSASANQQLSQERLQNRGLGLGEWPLLLLICFIVSS